MGVDDKGVEKGNELKSAEIGEMAEEKVDVPDNVVLRKLLVSCSNNMVDVVLGMYSFTKAKFGISL